MRWLGGLFRRLGNWLTERAGPDDVDCSCSFCAKHRMNVEYLIAGPNGTYICEQCIELCRGILVENGWYRRQEEAAAQSLDDAPTADETNDVETE